MTHEGGPDNLGATFFEPSSIPDGFFMLGCYAQPNNKPLSGRILVAKDASNAGAALKAPIDYTLVWSSQSAKIRQDNIGYIWLPMAPEGYKAVGFLVTLSPDRPGLDRVQCVQSDFTDSNENLAWIWGPGKDNVSANGVNVYTSRPKVRGIQAMGVPTGTFVAQISGVDMDIPCLKNISENQDSMPNLDQINAAVEAYSPVVYFHPDEEYLPSSVTWFFDNGALLYTKGEESSPVAIDPTGLNLPQGGDNDDMYWIDLPSDDAEKERVKKGDIASASSYMHVKAMFGATFTDIAIWMFHPFNGPARAKVLFFNVPLGRIGEHVGDWEHVTLRISNFNGELWSVYFSEHSKGVWLDASELEFGKGNKPVGYSSLHGHSMYPKPGLVMQGSSNIGIRNDTAKGKVVMDCGASFAVVSAEHLGLVEPAWLNFARKWGPKITYKTEEEIRRVEKVLLRPFRSLLERIVKGLPSEVLGEEGPVGPKGKDNWSGDERS